MNIVSNISNKLKRLKKFEVSVSTGSQVHDTNAIAARKGKIHF